jgi:hypothetical protein
LVKGIKGMKRMKLNEVERFTHRKMTVAEAITISNPGFGCEQQALALSMLTRLNTATDWLRLQACLVILRNRKAAYAAAQARRDGK